MPLAAARDAQLDACFRQGGLTDGRDTALRLPSAQVPEDATVAHGIGFGEALRVWARIALLSFGGPAGQIAVMHRVLVEERRWVSEARFLHALNYCMLLPGPEAQQLATYIGWLMHRTPGGLVAGGLFVLPGVIALMVLSWIYVIWGEVSVVAGLFFGLKAAVLAVVIEAVLRVGRRALKTRLAVVIAGLAFVALFAFAVPFPLVVLTAAIIGVAAHRMGYAVGAPTSHGSHGDDRLGETIPSHATPTFGRAVRVASVWLPLWLGPVVLLLVFAGCGQRVQPSRGLLQRGRGGDVRRRLRRACLCGAGGRRHLPLASRPARCWPASAWRRRRQDR